MRWHWARAGALPLTIAGAAAPLISGLISNSAINKTKAPPKPAEFSPAKLKTNYNINPQLAELNRVGNRASADIDANTASSSAALARKQRINTDIGMQKNLLYGQKENIESEMINKDALNRQQVSSQNIAQNNAYNSRVNQFDTEKRLAKADVMNQMIGETSSAIGDYQSRADKKVAENKALAAIMARTPEQVDLFMSKKNKYSKYLSNGSFKCGGKAKLSRKK